MEEGSEVVVGVIVSIVLGFLPSFLLFSAFNQSNFSLISYRNFLLDINTSWFSWFSIFIIAIIVYFFMIRLQSKKKKAIVLFLIASLSIVFVLFFLYANFLLGNDILVKLSSDKENIFFEDSPNQSLTFTTSALMNPFCIAQCQYSFVDLSTGEEIESGEFSMASVLPTTKEYFFSREGHLQGQALNRFEIRCKSQKTNLCYTHGEESIRSILITLNYDLSSEQKALNDISKKEIDRKSVV